MKPHSPTEAKKPIPKEKIKTGHKYHPHKKVKRSFVDPSGMEGFKAIEDFRNDYKDSTFWIIGSDPNLDFYPDNFFDDKFSIAIYTSSVAFPNSTFFLIPTNPVASAIKYMRPEFLSKCIMPLNCTMPRPMPFWRQVDPYWGDYGLEPIYLKLLAGTKSSHTDSDREKMVEQIFGNGSIAFVQPSSSAYYAVEVAAVLGAKKIVLVGMSHKATRDHFHAQKRGMWIFSLENRPGGKNIYPDSYINGTIPELAIMRKDTIWLKNEFAKYGVEIVRHRFDEEIGEFMFEEIGTA